MANQKKHDKPNIILCMTDDQGWKDTSYSGHPELKTPNLDQMSKDGVRFSRWYSAAPVCSPTRGSCLTGRHPYRYGIFHANEGHLPPEELNLAEVLKKRGYRTGHFGKWHLGTLSKVVREANRGGPRCAEHYSPPWKNGFDTCFSTESKVPTWDPMLIPEGWEVEGARKPGQAFGTYYWTGPGRISVENLEGDDSRVLMDRGLSFIREAVQEEEPFLAVIWFHSPHAPVVGGPKYRDMYSEFPPGKQHYYGCLTAMDEQIGRLRRELNELGVGNNTMLWFCSDNGPEEEGAVRGKGRGGHQQGQTGPFRGRKRDLYEGGIRVPGLLVWPNEIERNTTVEAPCVTSDYFPTILEVLDISPDRQPKPIDGVDLMPLVKGKVKERSSPIGFEFEDKLAWTDDRYKLVREKGEFELFDLLKDPSESEDLSEEKPKVFSKMKTELKKWRSSCEDSRKKISYL